MPKENIAGPTVLWSEIKDKKVKSNNGKKLGQIKDISQNHFKIEKGRIRKNSFWVPKNLADAYDGKYVWLSSEEGQIHDKFFYGEEPPESDQTGSPVNRIRFVDKRMAGIPTPVDSSEEYKNIRDVEK
jgi:sporulation protein YlmC with PRC-barrel domain